MMAENTTTGDPRKRTAFVRLWLALTLSYVLLRFLFDLLVRGWIDLDWVLSPWPLVLPIAQAAVFWLLARRWPARDR
jgi:hypothetical protein